MRDAIALTALDAGLALKAAPLKAPAPNKNEAGALKAAKEFEAVFLNEVFGAMFEGIKTDGPFGGGAGEQIFRSLMVDQYARTISAQGGIGLADAVKRQLMTMQEAPR